MRKILNYKTSKHFSKQMLKRKIDPLLVSYCIAKGKIIKEKEQKKIFILTKEKLIDTVNLAYIDLTFHAGIYELRVIIKQDRLITVYGRYGDIGIFNK